MRNDPYGGYAAVSSIFEKNSSAGAAAFAYDIFIFLVLQLAFSINQALYKRFAGNLSDTNVHVEIKISLRNRLTG